jgi:hypothetical protein
LKSVTGYGDIGFPCMFSTSYRPIPVTMHWWEQYQTLLVYNKTLKQIHSIQSRQNYPEVEGWGTHLRRQPWLHCNALSSTPLRFQSTWTSMSGVGRAVKWSQRKFHASFGHSGVASEVNLSNPRWFLQPFNGESELSPDSSRRQPIVARKALKRVGEVPPTHCHLPPPLTKCPASCISIRAVLVLFLPTEFFLMQQKDRYQ